MKTIEKSWGQQVWLDDHRQIMLMKADGQTSYHCHWQYRTRLVLLSGRAFINSCGTVEALYGETSIGVGQPHRIVSDIGCTLYEEYLPWSDPPTILPEEDIERLKP